MVRRTGLSKADKLRILAERQLGLVHAAARVNMRGWEPERHVLAVTDEHLFWIQIRRRWPLDLGAVGYWMVLDGTKVHTEDLGLDRFRLSVSRRFEGIHHRGVIYGPGAAHLVGHLAAREFALS